MKKVGQVSNAIYNKRHKTDPKVHAGLVKELVAAGLKRDELVTDLQELIPLDPSQRREYLRAKNFKPLTLGDETLEIDQETGCVKKDHQADPYYCGDANNPEKFIHGHAHGEVIG